MTSIFDIDDAFERFMLRVYPAVRETDRQWIESRRIFAAGMASLFLFLQSKEYAALSEADAQQQLKLIDHDLTDYFMRRISEQEEL